MIRFLIVIFLVFMFGVTFALAVQTGDTGFMWFALLFLLLSVISAMVFISEERLAGR